MKQSAFDTALRLVKHFEGFRATAYKDPVGVWTIGYGETGPFVHADTTVTEPEAARWLADRLLLCALEIGRLVTGVYLMPHQTAALQSFLYNIGSGAFARSTMRRKLNAGDFDGAAAEFPKWRKAGGKVLPGLVRRRDAERRLFEGEELEAIL